MYSVTVSQDCHCEERSDVAISYASTLWRLPRPLRGLAMTILALFSAMLFLSGCGGGGFSFPTAVVGVTPVTVDTWRLSYTTSGTVEANNKVDMNVETAGTIIQLNFKEGDVVSKGQTLIRLKADKYAAQVGESAAQIQSARQNVSVQDADAQRLKAMVESSKAKRWMASEDLKRFEKLYQEQFISSQELDQKRTMYETANADYQAALKDINAAAARKSAALSGVSSAQSAYRYSQALAGETVIRAPFNGKVGQKYVALGDYVLPAEKIVTVVDDSIYKIKFTLPERYLAYLKTGQQVLVSFDGNFAKGGHPLSGKVNFIDAVVDANSRTLAVKAIIEDGKNMLRHGQSAVARIMLADIPNALIIPEQALVPQGEKNFVYLSTPLTEAMRKQHEETLKKDKTTPPIPKDATHQVSLREVVIASRDAGRVQVVSGLKPGDRVVVDGLQKIFDGATVKEGDFSKQTQPSVKQ